MLDSKIFFKTFVEIMTLHLSSERLTDKQKNILKEMIKFVSNKRSVSRKYKTLNLDFESAFHTAGFYYDSNDGEKIKSLIEEAFSEYEVSFEVTRYHGIKLMVTFYNPI